jgi:hypothetical protein
MATLKIYERPDTILTYDGECTIDLTAHKAGMNVVVNSKDNLCIASLELTDTKRLASEARRLAQQHGDLRDKLAP